MDNDNEKCFERIVVGHQRWSKKSASLWRFVSVVLLFLICLLFVLQGIDQEDVFQKFVFTFTPVCLFIEWRSRNSWARIISNELRMYQPLDTQAFVDLQRTTEDAYGELQMSALGTWIAVERKSLVSHSSLFKVESETTKPSTKGERGENQN